MSSDAVDKIVAAVEQHRAAMSAVAARKPSATEAYKAEQKACLDLMSALSAKIMQHHTKQAADQSNWGYVGDLQHVNSLLRQALGEE